MLIFSLVVISLLGGLYGWLSCVAAGVSLLRLLPSSTFTKHGLRLFAPRWEYSQLLLIGMAIGVVFIFGHDSDGVATQAVRRVALAAGLTILLRSLLLIILSYRKLPTGLRPINLLYSVCSFAVPFFIGAVGVTALQGASFKGALDGWIITIALVMAVIAVALSFVYYVVGRTPHDRLHQLSRWLNIASCLFSLGAAELIMRQHNYRLQSLAFIGFMVLLFGVVLWQAILWFGARERYMWWYLSGCIVIAPLLAALANRPYALFPTLLLHTSYGATTKTSALLVALLVLMIALSTLLLLRPLTQVVKKQRQY